MRITKLFSALLLGGALLAFQAACGFIGSDQCGNDFVEHCEGQTRLSCYHGAEHNEIVRDACASCASLRPDTAVCRPAAVAATCSSQPPLLTAPITESLDDPNVHVTAALADMNGDGRLDVVTLAGEDVVVLANRGDGTFETRAAGVPTSAAVAWASARLFAGDFDGDGKADVVVADGLALHRLRGGGDGSLSSVAAQATGRFDAAGAVDVDGDGRLDVIGIDASLKPKLWTATSTGFAAGVDAPWKVTARRASAGVGDIDGDGMIEVLDGTRVVSSGGGTLTIFGHRRATTARFGDVDGDGKDDVVFSDLGPSDSLSTPTVHVAFGPSATDIMNLPTSAFRVRALVVADLDGDGTPDILGSDADAGVVVTWRGLGGRRFEAPRAATVAADRGTLVLAANLFGDAAPELVIVGEHGVYVVTPTCL